MRKACERGGTGKRSLRPKLENTRISTKVPIHGLLHDLATI